MLDSLFNGVFWRCWVGVVRMVATFARTWGCCELAHVLANVATVLKPSIRAVVAVVCLVVMSSAMPGADDSDGVRFFREKIEPVLKAS